MFVFETEFSIPAAPGHKSLLSHSERALQFRLSDHSIPLRFAITQSDQSHYQCEIGMLEGLSGPQWPIPDSVFRFVRRSIENTGNFNAALLVPTGIGAEIGGHAGDANPVAKLIGACCDTSGVASRDLPGPRNPRPPGGTRPRREGDAPGS